MTEEQRTKFLEAYDRFDRAAASIQTMQPWQITVAVEKLEVERTAFRDMLFATFTEKS